VTGLSDSQLFKEDLAPAAIAIPLLGTLMSALWYLTGAQDRYLVAMITHAAERLAPGDREWAHPGLFFETALGILGDKATEELHPGLTLWRSQRISVTRLPALVPLLIGCLWIVAAVVVAIVA
jgi:hypothetical protein